MKDWIMGEKLKLAGEPIFVIRCTWCDHSCSISFLDTPEGEVALTEYMKILRDCRKAQE